MDGRLRKMSRWCTVLGILMLTLSFSSLALAESPERNSLRFNSDRTFKIVQFTDTQDTQDTDPRTIALINTVLDDQTPDLVVFTGDNIRGGDNGPKTLSDVLKAIGNIVAPVDRRKIPWLITFGNHDEEHMIYTGLDEDAMLEVMSRVFLSATIMSMTTWGITLVFTWGIRPIQDSAHTASAVPKTID